MDFKELLIQNRKTIVDGWVEATLKTYPPETFKFFVREPDQFRNPVGYSVAEGLTNLFDELLGDIDPGKIKKELDKIIRIRSVQDFKPSEAVSCVFLLKSVIRENLNHLLENKELLDELLDFEGQIDCLALAAFDNYNECRENLYEIRINQAKTGSVKIIERLNRRPDTKQRS